MAPKKSVSQPRDRDTISKLVQVVKPPPPHSSDARETDGSLDDDEDSDVDDEGLEKLVSALGEDGLDEFDLAQLRMLSGAAADWKASDEEEGSGDSEEEPGAESGPEDGEPGDREEVEEGEEMALDGDDVDSVDQDAIPRRKVQVDNKVRPFPLFHCQFVLFCE